MAALQVLAVIKRRERPASEVCRRFEPLPQVLKSVRVADSRILGHEPIRAVIDGARARLGSAGRLVIRPSGTEPVIRVMGEADDRALVDSIVDDVCSALIAHAVPLAAE